MAEPAKPFWSKSSEQLLQELKSSAQGLSNAEVKKRLVTYGPNRLKPEKRTDSFTLFLSQFKSPIILILVFAAGLSAFLKDTTDAAIILAIIFISGLLGFLQERGAAKAVAKLLEMVQVQATVLRDGNPVDIPIEEVVPGDVVILKAGDVIPGDCAIIESKDLFVDEAALTGETFPVEKAAGTTASEAGIAKRLNTLFMGTHTVSGQARALVVHTGFSTEFGKISERLKLRPPETEFEHGVRRFGYFLMEVTLLLVVAVFAINVYFHRPVLDSFLFSMALAVGLTPQLLPAIISINLSHGAKRMALVKVIVKRLAAIENFGSMNVLCSDKTGTLTQGVVKIHSALDPQGTQKDKVLFYAYLNAFYETGFANPIDQAIRSDYKLEVGGFSKLDEVPYDFLRKRVTVLVKKDGKGLMITKGALENVLAVCSKVESGEGQVAELAGVREKILQKYEELSRNGFRTLGVAYREFNAPVINKDCETDMIFLGFLVFHDPIKPGIAETLASLEVLGVEMKIITGDNQLVAAHIAGQVGVKDAGILTGAKLRAMSDEALMDQVTRVKVFAEVEPNQKERIILALKKAGCVVGFIGDGINDASSLHAADVGISVDSAVDVAKEAADIVLLEHDLGVLARGIREGRRTFANTLKYVFMATSANFGNMFSMAGASLFLTFLPLLPKQILLTNLLTDFPEMTISTDHVDRELVDRPRRWDIGFIRKFMLMFGALSSVFDFLTFGALLYLLKANVAQFRTGWFIESVISASVIVLIIRSRRPFFRSRPGIYMISATLAVVAATAILPYTPLARAFGFQPLPFIFLLMVAAIVSLYILSAELAKKIFYHYTKF